MKKEMLIIFALILSVNCYSQIHFEKGYFIDDTNKKIDCLIKNIDRKNTPTGFVYKLNENEKAQKATLNTVKEFGITNVSKFIRSKVNIDRSPKNIGHLTKTRNPIFNEEELFLKVLVEGKSNLYEYIDGNLTRFFYNTESSNIEQLIFKNYKTSEGDVGKNLRYKQQLFNNLKCDNITTNKIDRIDYKKKDLVRFFIEYNQCVGSEIVNLERNHKKELFNLTLKPQINSASLSIENDLNPSRNVDFGNKIGFGFGLELEYILPINKNKWGVYVEPTYRNFKSEKTIDINTISGGKLTNTIDYKSIEVPVGIRHYLFINDQSKIFIGVSYMIYDFSSSSSIAFTRADGSMVGGSFSNLDIKTKRNMNVAVGYKYNDKYSIALSYQTNRDILNNYIYWSSRYNTVSIIFGYSLF